MYNRRNITIKFLLAAVILGVFLPRLGAVTMWQALFAAAVITLVGYLTDFVMLAKINAITALALDAVINTLVIWVVQLITPFMYVSFISSFIASLLLAAGELFFHTFLLRQYNR